MTIEQLIKELQTLDQNKEVRVVAIEGWGEWELKAVKEITIDKYDRTSSLVDNPEADDDFYLINC